MIELLSRISDTGKAIISIVIAVLLIAVWIAVTIFGAYFGSTAGAFIGFCSPLFLIAFFGLVFIIAEQVGIFFVYIEEKAKKNE